MPAEPCVTILMATCNGAAHLPEQLASFRRQSHSNWRLHVSDDGSTDATVPQLEGFASEFCPDRVALHAGPGKGAAANFLSLFQTLPVNGPVALADQDDVWAPDKLARGLAALQTCSNPVALYGSRCRYVDASLAPLGLSPLPRRTPDFSNALVQNPISGNTMLLSSGAAALVKAAGTPDVPHHDWWILLLTSGAGGQIVFDPRPGLDYRLHSDNSIGARRGLARMAAQTRRFFDGRYGGELARNLGALQGHALNLTTDNQHRLAAMQAATRSRGRAALKQLRRAGVYRQAPRETALLKAAGWMGQLQ